MALQRPIATVIVLLGALAGGMAHAGGDPSTAAGTLAAPSTPSPASELPLFLSIRALAVGQTTFPQVPEVERITAPTGAGTTRWPTGEIAKGVYLHVNPVCIPGVDEPLGPGARRNLSPRRR
jgi:hypothetical protein